MVTIRTREEGGQHTSALVQLYTELALAAALLLRAAAAHHKVTLLYVTKSRRHVTLHAVQLSLLLLLLVYCGQLSSIIHRAPGLV
jgi:hypothetical protein